VNTRRLLWSRLAAAFILAAGIQIVWGIIFMWTSATFTQMSRSNQYYETVGITGDGKAVVATRSFTDPLDWSYRTFDGQPLPDLKEDNFLTSTQLPAAAGEPGVFAASVPWSSRLAALSDSRRNPTSWYVVRDRHHHGHAYLVGFDVNANRLVGYMGRNGFRRTMPPAEEWFDMERRVLAWASGAVASTGSLQYGGPATLDDVTHSSQPRLPFWFLYLIDGDKLLEIDLRERTLRAVFAYKDLNAVEDLLEAVAPNVDDIDDASNAVPDADATTAAQAEETNISAPPPKQTARLVLRAAKEIIVLDPPTGDKQEFKLPESIRDQHLEVYVTASEQLVALVRDNWSWTRPRIFWLNADGTVEREEQTTLATYGGAESSGLVVAAAPIPLAWIAGVFIAGPLVELQQGTSASYIEAVGKILKETWPAVIAVTLIGMASAACTYWLQRKYHRTATGAWCTFVFLFGLPAFLAYWIEQSRPKVETCGDCGSKVPRDRDACAVCRAPFPAPPLLGTEIFA
jgi:hypothetical protein